MGEVDIPKTFLVVSDYVERAVAGIGRNWFQLTYKEENIIETAVEIIMYYN